MSSQLNEQVNKGIDSMLKTYKVKDQITREDALRHFKETGSKYPERSTTYLFRALDKDHNGVISMDEIRQNCIQEYLDNLEDSIEVDIESFLLKNDTNKDKVIKRKEMLEYFEDLNVDDPKNEVDKIFNDIDSNKDGVITIDELRTYFKKKYDNFGPQQ